MSLGWTEILLIGAVAMLVFGPKKLPELGRSLGDAIKGFKKGLSDEGPERPVNSTQIAQNDEVPLNADKATQKETEVKKS